MTNLTQKQCVNLVDGVKLGGLSRCVLCGTLQRRGQASRIGGKKHLCKKKKRGEKDVFITVAGMTLHMLIGEVTHVTLKKAVYQYQYCLWYSYQISNIQGVKCILLPRLEFMNEKTNPAS
ncbi:hypothetical protein PGT21_022418 [Puccinia graminis f. sp. tritici]|uniref:Uncharacterized protein n=1 Tax=Puccinia graminis f. sp. tritici TaxID=56615 RepID=A0A5B0NV08_PUCGR|nr:hypothetical protein PGT21_022418 [Puccinia graminis f. sp. tritici]